MTQARTILISSILLSGFVCNSLRAAADAPSAPLELTGFTRASRQLALAPLESGRVEALCADEGTWVEAGQTLVLLDAQIRRLQAEIARVEAESTLEIQLAQVARQRAGEELARLERLDGEAAASAKELVDARFTVRSAEVALELARQKHAQAQRNSALQAALLARMSLEAPFTGIIAEQHKHVGDTVEEREPILTLLQLDPLVVTLDCPVSVARGIRAGDEFQLYADDVHAAPRHGRVTLVSPAADAASQTVRIKLQVENPQHDWPSGMRVRARGSTPLEPRVANLAGAAAQPN